MVNWVRKRSKQQQYCKCDRGKMKCIIKTKISIYYIWKKERIICIGTSWFRYRMIFGYFCVNGCSGRITGQCMEGKGGREKRSRYPLSSQNVDYM